MGPARRRALVLVRFAVVALCLLALAQPAVRRDPNGRAVIFVLDHSDSQDAAARQQARERAEALAAALPGDTWIGCVSAGETPVVLQMPARSGLQLPVPLAVTSSGHTHLSAAVELAAGLFPPGCSKRLVIISDFVETRGDLRAAAREASLSFISIDTVTMAAEPRPDARIVRFRPNQSRLHEGAAVDLAVDIESSLTGAGRIRLFENGIEVERRDLTLEQKQPSRVIFKRTLHQRDLYRFRVVIDSLPDDSIAGNNEAISFVDVIGRPRLLYIEGEPDQAHFLRDAMAAEGIVLEVRPPSGIPGSLQQLAAYDGVIFSDLSARHVDLRTMSLVRDYVESLGGGFVMIGGEHSFGVGGYYRTPIEDLLPVKMKAPDVEETYGTALCLVIDRSGSMQGQKIEVCKSAAAATLEMLSPKDHVGVASFDSIGNWVVPMTRVTDRDGIRSRISSLDSGGGTNVEAGMRLGRDGLIATKAKVKHMIVLTDGQTSGSNYRELASLMHTEGITISTVAVGDGADEGLLQAIAEAGGGKYYKTLDLTSIPRIFTQDAMTHLGRLIREEPFVPVLHERQPMIKGWPLDEAPQLLGYVKTQAKSTAQVPLVTDLGDPLLAQWRFGLGTVTAFTSDCKSRWSPLWLTNWNHGYGQLWAQILRETARDAQGQYMDIHLQEAGDALRISVDVMESAGSYSQNIPVSADIYQVPAHAIGSDLKLLASVALDQVGPGNYVAGFTPEQPGVYLVRARAGASMVTAGYVHQIYAEAATGRVDEALADAVAGFTGGSRLGSTDGLDLQQQTGDPTFDEMKPYFLRALILLFLIDLLIRRWENTRSVGQWCRERLAGLS